MDRLLKKVNKESWQEFKAESARHGMRMGEFLGYLVKEHKNREEGENAWGMILKRKKERAITDKEAENMKKAIEVFEKIDYE